MDRGTRGSDDGGDHATGPRHEFDVGIHGVREAAGIVEHDRQWLTGEAADFEPRKPAHPGPDRADAQPPGHVGRESDGAWEAGRR